MSRRRSGDVKRLPYETVEAKSLVVTKIARFRADKTLGTVAAFTQPGRS
jgi:hypothetical protein